MQGREGGTCCRGLPGATCKLDAFLFGSVSSCEGIRSRGTFLSIPSSRLSLHNLGRATVLAPALSHWPLPAPHPRGGMVEPRVGRTLYVHGSSFHFVPPPSPLPTLRRAAKLSVASRLSPWPSGNQGELYSLLCNSFPAVSPTCMMAQQERPLRGERERKGSLVCCLHGFISSLWSSCLISARKEGWPGPFVLLAPLACFSGFPHCPAVSAAALLPPFLPSASCLYSMASVFLFPSTPLVP